MIREEERKLQSSSHQNDPTNEIDQLFQKAIYYERLGCVDVARSLKQMAAAKKMRFEWRVVRP